MSIQQNQVTLGAFASQMWCLYRIVVLVGLFCGVQLSSVWAAEWSLLPSIGVKGVYNDNLLLDCHCRTSDLWLLGLAGGRVRRKDRAAGGKWPGAADFVSYYGGGNQFTNIFLPLTLRYKTEKDLFGFTGGFIRDNTLMSELLTPDWSCALHNGINGRRIRPGPEASLKSCRFNPVFNCPTPPMRMAYGLAWWIISCSEGQAGCSIK